MTIGTIGNAFVRLIKSQDLIEIALAAGRNDPAFALCDNSHCPDCISQRAAVRKAAFEREKFTVVSSAALAGEFVEEISVRCLEAGICAVELDSLRRRPLSMLKPPAIAEAIRSFREKGIRVVSLRAAAVSSLVLELIKLAREHQVPRIVAPLSRDARDFALAANEAQVIISFYNSDLDSDACSQILLSLADEGLPARFTFNGANFARGGELPFLISYKKKLRRFVDQLDLVDGAYDGSPQRLACGNAEVKEMISILRCASFAGSITLAAGNRHTATLAEVAARFESLLQEM